MGILIWYLVGVGWGEILLLTYLVPAYKDLCFSLKNEHDLTMKLVSIDLFVEKSIDE